MRLVLTLSNRPDGTSTGSIVNLDEGGLQLPVTIAGDASKLVLEMTVIGGTYAGTLNADNAELVGTYSQAEQSVPLTFRRAAAADGKK